MYEKELKEMISAVKEAEKVILEIYNQNFDVEIKSDHSPVTLADKKADALIRKILGEKFPTYGFLTEESTDNKERLEKEFVFIVDPVDGTKEFVKRNGQFATNIGLARNHELVAGVINLPTYGLVYYATKDGGAFKMDREGNITKLHVSDRLKDLRCLQSVSFLNDEEVALMEKHKDIIASREPVGAAIKFCRIAEGEAEISYRMNGRTKEWDTAAGEIILEEAGGFMIKPDGSKYLYNREDPYNKEGYILVNRKENFLL